MRRMVFGALFIALGLILPSVFHAVGMGPTFLPMHIPVLLGGMLLGPGIGLVIGFLTPLLSTLLTQMPPMVPPISPMMMFELATYGLVAGLLTRSLRQNVFVALAGAWVAGRVVLGLAAVVTHSFFGFHPTAWDYVWGSVVTGVWGLLIQVIVIPVLYRLLVKLPVNTGVREATRG